MDTRTPTTFVLGAGFSCEQQLPLIYGLKERVVHFLEAEQRSSYFSFLRKRDNIPEFPRGEFYSSLEHADPDGSLGFEELLAKMQQHLRKADKCVPCIRANEVMRIGTWRFFWALTSSNPLLDKCYQNFAQRLRESHGSWRIVSFNWDILVEQALTQARAEWRYSLSEAKEIVALIKPHGSMNWNSFAQDPNVSSRYSGWKRIGPESKLSYDAAHPLDNPDSQETNPDFRYCLFPGDPDEPDEHNDLKLLWKDAREAILGSERVVFLGYSMPDYDTFAGTAIRSACKDKVVEVCDPSRATLQRFRDSFPLAELREQYFRNTSYAAALT